MPNLMRCGELRKTGGKERRENYEFLGPCLDSVFHNSQGGKAGSRADLAGECPPFICQLLVGGTGT